MKPLLPLDLIDCGADDNEPAKDVTHGHLRYWHDNYQWMYWRPIESAPHETRVLLGWWHEGQWLSETAYASHGWRRHGVSNMSRHSYATHWMPLPAPPDSLQDRGAQ